MIEKGFWSCCFLLAIFHFTNAQITDTTAINYINTPYDEHNLFMAHNNTVIAVSRAYHPDNSGGKKDEGDIWLMEKSKDGKWNIPQKVAAWNNNRWNGVVGLMPDNKTMLLHGHYENTKTQGISYSVKRGSNWSKPKDINIPYFINKSKHQSASLSIDGKVIVFSIESYGTKGGEDLYVSFLKKGKWSEPKNMGPLVNTKYQEMAPYLASDNKTLYFASNGHLGFGSFDLYVTQRLDDTWRNWSEPENLGPLVNTSATEKGVVYNFHSQVINFLSTKDSNGYGDLKFISLKPTFKDSYEIVEVAPEDTVEILEVMQIEESAELQTRTTIPIQFVDNTTQKPIDVTFTIESEPVSGNKQSVNGAYPLPLDGLSYVNISVEQKGYFIFHKQFDSLDIVESPALYCYIEPIAVGKTVRLENVLFQRGTTKLLEESYPVLDEVAKMLLDNSEMQIELSGHTDNLGNPHVNMRLSRERAESVKRYLVGKGVKKKRVLEKGYGGNKPIASNKTEATRRLNRRVEFTVLKF